MDIKGRLKSFIVGELKQNNWNTLVNLHSQCHNDRTASVRNSCGYSVSYFIYNNSIVLRTQLGNIAQDEM